MGNMFSLLGKVGFTGKITLLGKLVFVGKNMRFHLRVDWFLLLKNQCLNILARGNGVVYPNESISVSKNEKIFPTVEKLLLRKPGQALISKIY